MTIKHYLQPWVLITIGIVMNITSAIVTHFFISQNNTDIQTIEQKIIAMETHIDSQWQNKSEMERKKEFALLLLNKQPQQAIKTEIKTYLLAHLASLKKHYLSPEQKQHFNNIDLMIHATIQLTRLAQQTLINDINDQYFEKLELEASQKPLKDSNAILYSIAIFMQLIGLILVLSRDLARQ